MDLGKWIEQQNRSVLDISREWKVTYQTLKKIIERRSEPRCELALYISEQTGGAVTLMDLRGWVAHSVIPSALPPAPATITAVQMQQPQLVAQFTPPAPQPQQSAAVPRGAAPRRWRQAAAGAGATPVTLPPVPMQTTPAPAQPQRRQRRTSAQAGV